MMMLGGDSALRGAATGLPSTPDGPRGGSDAVRICA